MRSEAGYDIPHPYDRDKGGCWEWGVSTLVSCASFLPHLGTSDQLGSSHPAVTASLAGKRGKECPITMITWN